MDIFSKEHTEAREKYGTTKQANYWLNTLDTSYLNSQMIEMIENINYFFFATSSKDGRSNVNFKGTDNGKLLKVLNKNKIIFPDYRGNGILHSIGDIYSNPYVSLLIIDFNRDIRIKISGKATIIDDKKQVSQYLDQFDSFEFDRLIEIDIDYAIPNCSNKISIVRESILNS